MSNNNVDIVISETQKHIGSKIMDNTELLATVEHINELTEPYKDKLNKPTSSHLIEDLGKLIEKNTDFCSLYVFDKKKMETPISLLDKSYEKNNKQDIYLLNSTFGPNYDIDFLFDSDISETTTQQIIN